MEPSVTARRSRLESMLMRAWGRRGIVACALFPLSLVFRLVSGLRRAAYRNGWRQPVRMKVPVIVVGNIFVGGTGKTPLTIWLVKQLQRAGFRPGVISRGYGAASDVPQAVTSASSPAEVGDEPVLIAAGNVPVMVGRWRVDAARALLDRFPDVDVIVSDDGLQHYALARDIEIMLFDARGVGNGWLLPAGPLREPVSRRSDFVVVNAATPPAWMPRNAVPMQLRGAHAVQLRDPTHVLPLAAFAAGDGEKKHPPRILAAAGIGNPGRFFSMLEGAGLQVARMPLPDHFDFADNPFAGIEADIILITEKDAVKCRRIDNINNDPRLWVVPVAAHIDHALADRIVEKLRGNPTV